MDTSTIIAFIAIFISVASLTLNILDYIRTRRRRKNLISKIMLNSMYGKHASGKVYDVNSIYPVSGENTNK